MQGARDQADSLKKQIEDHKNEAERILTKLRQIAAKQGVSQQAIYFKEESDRHSEESVKWRIDPLFVAMIFFLLSLINVAIYIFDWIKFANIPEAIPLGLSKVLVFAAVGYVLLLCGNNFLFHTHNYIVNRHRQNALLTFNVLAASAKEDDRRDIVLSYAAAGIFSPQETGYAKGSHGQDGPAVKLIEIAPKVSGGASGH